MAQAGYTPVQLYRTTTVSAAPSAGNLSDGELAINITDGKLFYKDNLGAVQTIATKATAALTTPISPANGGTGVANGANNTITFSGNYTLGITLSGNTSVTLPTTGTLTTKGVAITYSILFGL